MKKTQSKKVSAKEVNWIYGRGRVRYVRMARPTRIRKSSRKGF